MVLKEKTQEAFDFIKNHGGECKTSDIMEGLGLEKIASVTGRVNSLVKNGLAVTEDGGKTEDGKLTFRDTRQLLTNHYRQTDRGWL